MLVVTGAGSAIVKELIKLPLCEERVVPCRVGDVVPLDAQRYFLCAGVMIGASFNVQASKEKDEAFNVNWKRPVSICEHVLDCNSYARICIIGSESGFSGSYDHPYAASKAALHHYVETKKLKPKQQLVCIAPSIIEDCGMTLRRTDTENLERRRNEHPKKRFLTAKEVAKLVHFVLYEDQGYLSNVVIRMNGGSHVS